MTQDAGAILSYPIAWRGGDAGSGITLQGHRDTSGNLVSATVDTQDYIEVEKFDFSPLDFRDQRDGLHLLFGGDLGLVSSEFRYVSIQGNVKGSTAAKLEDRVAKLLGVFDPENCQAASATTRGVLPLDFYCPTEEAGYTPLVRELFQGRPTGLPVIFERRAEGYAMQFALQLVCPDPRRYLYTAESKVANAGNGYSIAIPNWTARMGAPTTGVITLALTAAGANPCTLRYVDTASGITKNLNLNLSGIGGGAHTVTVDVETGEIKLDGTNNAALRTSAVDTAQWIVNAGGGTFSVPAGTTNLTSATLAYRQARA